MCRFSHSAVSNDDSDRARSKNEFERQPSASSVGSSASVPAKFSDPASNAKLFVGNILPGSTAKEIKEIFEQFGPLKDKEVDMKEMFAFVYFEHRKDMEKALAGGPYIVQGEQLRCEESRSLKLPKTVKVAIAASPKPSALAGAAALPPTSASGPAGAAAAVALHIPNKPKDMAVVRPPTLYQIEALHDRLTDVAIELSFKKKDILEATTNPDANGWVNARLTGEPGHGRLVPFSWFRKL